MKGAAWPSQFAYTQTSKNKGKNLETTKRKGGEIERDTVAVARKRLLYRRKQRAAMQFIVVTDVEAQWRTDRLLCLYFSFVIEWEEM